MALEMKFDFEEKLEKLAQIPRVARLGGVAAIVVGVLAGYYFLFYQGAVTEVQRLSAQSQELQRQLNKVRIVATNLGEFELEVANLERELEQALKQLPNRKQFEDLLQDITTAGKKVGVAIKSIERQDEVLHDFYAEVPFDLELEGGYHDLALFFERVARLPRIVNVGSLDVRVADESPQRTTLRAEGTATTFRFLADEEEGA